MFLLLVVTVVAPQVKFELAEFMGGRDASPDFVLVEFGHDALPIAYNQPRPFTGGRAYIGVESWQRDPIYIKRQALDELHQQFAGNQNIFYTQIDPGGQPLREGDRSSRYYVGPYNPRTVLPEGIASEVFIGNLFGDPHVSQVAQRSEDLLAEASRLLAFGGHLVVRETIKPWEAQHLSQPVMGKASLTPVARFSPDNSDAWAALEQVYARETTIFTPYDDSFYVIAAKQ